MESKTTPSVLRLSKKLTRAISVVRWETYPSLRSRNDVGTADRRVDKPLIRKSARCRFVRVAWRGVTKIKNGLRSVRV
ncbi:hypothetical protein NDU88_004908 [Pleurodeles waltl]|uniref:Uncharacterized protein n=1 Tax=Pleurodeles waltl TaxID=8319 RepID=A0AAV7TSL7_PLEWA|nr:hypothetical protein NDU88_004908 [Pleurodeles waltl]